MGGVYEGAGEAIGELTGNYALTGTQGFWWASVEIGVAVTQRPRQGPGRVTLIWHAQASP